MQKNNTRRFFLKGTLISATALFPFRNYGEALPKQTMQDRPAPISADTVQDFVKNAHGNFARVKELLEKEPNLLNAAWDWGKGDYETGMNAAGHMGHVDIADFLLSKGARMDIFCAAMLGRLEIVKPILDAYPNLKSSKGPHGITLIPHAEKGGDNARKVLDYLKELGAS